MVSVTLQTSDGSFTTPSGTDELAGRIDEVQYRAGEGPCLDATATPGLGMTHCPDLAADLAAHVATALRGTEVLARSELRSTQLEQALPSRHGIGQAKGILMERRGCTADEAFDVLRHTSQDLNTKLRDLAAKVVAEGGALPR